MKKQFLAKSLVAFCIGGILASQCCINSSAKNISKNKTKNYFFTDTSGAVMGAEVYMTINEKYNITSEGKVKYTSRTAYMWARYTGNANKPSLHMIPPRHFNSDGSVKNTFTWSNRDYIAPGGVNVVVSIGNDKNVTYAKGNKKYSQLSYTLGDSSYVLTPTVSGSCKLNLGVCY